jgi:hypothetical protein
MARARNIKPGFFTNGDLIECSPLARLLFIGLWTEADRRGVLEDRPKTLKLKLLPGDECDADELLEELASRGFIKRYEAEGVRCIYIMKFCQHQTPHQKEPENPMPLPPEHDTCTRQAPDKHQTSTEDAETSTASRAPALTVSTTDSTTDCLVPPVAGSDQTQPDDSRSENTTKRARQIPADFTVTDDMRSWAASHMPGVSVDAETENFIDYHRAKGSTMKDWTAAWRTWMRNAVKFGRPAVMPPASKPPVDRIEAAKVERERLLRGEFIDHVERQTYGNKAIGADQLQDRIAYLDSVIAGKVAA